MLIYRMLRIMNTVYTVHGSYMGDEHNFSKVSTLSQTHVSFLDGKHQQKTQNNTPSPFPPPPKKKQQRAFLDSVLLVFFFPVLVQPTIFWFKDPQKEVENSKKKNTRNLGIRKQIASQPWPGSWSPSFRPSSWPSWQGRRSSGR